MRIPFIGRPREMAPVPTTEVSRELTREERAAKLKSCIQISALGSQSRTELMDGFLEQFKDEGVAKRLVAGVIDWRDESKSVEVRSKNLNEIVEGLVDRVTA